MLSNERVTVTVGGEPVELRAGASLIRLAMRGDGGHTIGHCWALQMKGQDNVRLLPPYGDTIDEKAAEINQLTALSISTRRLP